MCWTVWNALATILKKEVLLNKTIWIVQIRKLQFPHFGLHQLVAGSYLSVAGAILGLIKPRRLSLFGTLLILWGLVRETITRKSADRYRMEAIYIYPTVLIAVVFAFLSIRKDVRKIVRSYKDKRHANYSCSHLKAKQVWAILLKNVTFHFSKKKRLNCSLNDSCTCGRQNLTCSDKIEMIFQFFIYLYFSNKKERLFYFIFYPFRMVLWIKK